MHEVALVNSIIKMAENKIGNLLILRTINLSLGNDACVSYEALEFALNVAIQKYNLAPIKLQVEVIENSAEIKVKSFEVAE